MNGYLPHDLFALADVVGFCVVVLVAGLGITWVPSLFLARLAAWLLVVSAVIGAERLSASEPSGVRMLAIIVALFAAMKAVVVVEDQVAGRLRLSPLQRFFFATAWPGMWPSDFATVPGPARDRWREFVQRGLLNILIGSLLVVAAWYVGKGVESSIHSRSRLVFVTVLLLPGLSLVLHFGLFHVLAGVWRKFGANCDLLFRSPLQSTTLREFWGRRWNIPFSQMTALTVFRPLKNVVGARAATVTAFLFSGILHELAISVPVQAGYGLPLLYFAIHAAAMQVESGLSRGGCPVDYIPWVGRLWTLAWIVLPLPLLFHRPFLRGCVWPLIGVTDMD